MTPQHAAAQGASEERSPRAGRATDLADSAEVEIVLDNDLIPEERAALHASLDRALDGRGMDAATISGSIALVVKAVLLDEAQRRF